MNYYLQKLIIKLKKLFDKPLTKKERGYGYRYSRIRDIAKQFVWTRPKLIGSDQKLWGIARSAIETGIFFESSQHLMRETSPYRVTFDIVEVKNYKITQLCQLTFTGITIRTVFNRVAKEVNRLQQLSYRELQEYIKTNKE